MLTVIAAMEQELAGVKRLLKAAPAAPVELHVIGIGKERAESNIRKILGTRDWSSTDGLLLLGFAGGLDPALKTGDLVVPCHYYSESGDVIASDSEMWHQSRIAAMESAVTLAQGNSLTVAALLSTTEEKRESYRQHQVGSVNMEDYWVAKLAADAEVPFLSVRSVLDPASQALPGYVSGLAGHPVKAALSMLPKPWRVPPMLKLAKMNHEAQVSLTRLGFAVIYRQVSVKERELAEAT